MGRGLLQLLHHVGGDDLAGLPVAGIELKHVGVEGPVLVDLAGELDKVAVDVGAGLAFVAGARQHAVQAVAKLVEHCLHLVDGEQRGGVAGGLAEVAHVVDDGAVGGAVVVDPRALELAHPGTLALRGAWEVVGHEHGDVLAVGGVGDVVDLDLVVVFGPVGLLGELDVIKLLGHGEDAVAHAVDGKVGAHLGLVKVVLVAAYLLVVVGIVPRGDFYTGLLFVGQSLHLAHLLVGALDGGTPDLHQQVFGGLDAAGHDVVGHEGAVVLEAQQTCLLGAGLQDFADDGAVVVLARRGECGVTLVHAAAQVAVVSVLEDGQARGSVQREDVLALKAAGLGLVGGYVDVALGQTGKLGLVVDDNLEVVGGGKQVLVELKVKVGQLAVDGLELGLALLVEQGARAHKVFVEVLQHQLLVAVEAELVARVIEFLYAGKEGGVHRHLVGVGGQQGLELLGHGLELGAGVGLGQSGIDHHHALDECAGAVEGQHGVGKGGSLLVVGDGGNLGVVAADSLLEGGHIVLVLNQAEGRNPVRSVVLLQEGICLVHVACSVLGGQGRQCQAKGHGAR